MPRKQHTVDEVLGQFIAREFDAAPAKVEYTAADMLRFQLEHEAIAAAAERVREEQELEMQRVRQMFPASRFNSPLQSFGRRYPVVTAAAVLIAAVVGIDLGLRLTAAQNDSRQEEAGTYYAVKAGERPNQFAPVPEAVFNAAISMEDWDLCHREAALEFSGKIARTQEALKVARGEHTPCSDPGMVPQCVRYALLDPEISVKGEAAVEDECRKMLVGTHKCFDDRGQGQDSAEPAAAVTDEVALSANSAASPKAVK